MEEETKRMSKSRVLLYAGCPRKYKFEKILKIPFEMHPAAGIGKQVHEICDRFFDEIIATHDNKEKHFKEVIMELTPKDFDEKGKMYLENFVNNEIRRFGEGTNLLLLIPEHKEVTIINKEHNIIGIIDRIDLLEDGTLLVLDYKTGSPKPMKTYMYELSLYAWLIEQKFKKKVTKVGIAKLKNKNKVFDIVPITDEDKQKALQLTLQVRKLIEDEEFEPKKGNTCFWCPKHYKDLCEKLDKGEVKHETGDHLY